jgi:N-acetylglutamate synthase-like GNAT family acetyltransferase
LEFLHEIILTELFARFHSVRYNEQMKYKANDVQIRQATPKDLRELQALVEASFRTLGAAHYSSRQVAAALGPAIRVDADLLNDGTYFVADLNGTALGCGGWSTKRATAIGVPLPSPRAEVRAVFVAPEYAGLAIGWRLLRCAESAIVEAGFKSAYLLSTRSGLSFYLRAGYRALGEHLIPLDGAPALEVTMMQRVLEPADSA